MTTQTTAQAGLTDEQIQDVMFAVFDYASIADGIEAATFERRDQQRAKMFAQDRKIRGMLRALLASAQQVAPKEAEWLPIETAPHDTTEMFVVRAFNVNFHSIKNYTSDAYAVWANKGKFERWPHIDFAPTHWMPLPAAPAPTVQPTTAELPQPEQKG